MPGPGTFFAIGAAGVAGATAFANRNKKKEELGQNNDMTPFAIGRRGSRGTENDLYEPRKQAENYWRREYGVNLSHNSEHHFPGRKDSK
ncbi:hypothetical protein K492DRAFT_194938 [Lichtheimia hyalospora FSU 10163]|nr:hypothetical protein K492DRAFT_194938 [Lichtheimia hyalospora FSU 10163]